MSSIMLSIITVTYNCADALAQTIQSVGLMVPMCYWANIEYVIVDGKSTDTTLDVAKRELKKFQDEGMTISIESEKDSGIYNAMNKGLLRANGRWVYMLNAGDTLNETLVFEKIYDALKTTDANLLYGKTYRVHPEFQELWQPTSLESIKKGMIFCHQSVFIRKDLEEHHYDESYRYCADYDMILRMYLSGYVFEYVDQIISNYEMKGITATKALRKAYEETYHIRKRHGVTGSFVREQVQFNLGMLKCCIISWMPVKLRWGCTKFLRRIKPKKHF